MQFIYASSIITLWIEKNFSDNLILILCIVNFISISLPATPNAFKRFIWNLFELKNKTI